MLQIKDLSGMTIDDKIAYVSKIQKEMKVFKAQISEIKEELTKLYPAGTPNTTVGYKVSFNPEYPVFDTIKTKTGTKPHYTVTID